VEFKGLLTTGSTTVIIDQVDPNDGTKIRELGRFTSDPNPAGKDATGTDLYSWKGNIAFDESYFDSQLRLVLKPHVAENPLATFENAYWVPKCIKDNLGQGLGAVVNQCKSSGSPTVVIHAIKPNPAYCDPDYSYLPGENLSNGLMRVDGTPCGGGGYIGNRKITGVYACKFNHQIPDDSACPEGAFLTRYSDVSYTCSSEKSINVTCADEFSISSQNWVDKFYFVVCKSRTDLYQHSVNESVCKADGAINYAVGGDVSCCAYLEGEVAPAPAEQIPGVTSGTAAN
jgi:hypothetical protein